MSEWRILNPFPPNPLEETVNQEGEWQPVFPDPSGRMVEAGFALSGQEYDGEYEAE